MGTQKLYIAGLIGFEACIAQCAQLGLQIVYGKPYSMNANRRVGMLRPSFSSYYVPVIAGEVFDKEDRHADPQLVGSRLVSSAHQVPLRRRQLRLTFLHSAAGVGAFNVEVLRLEITGRNLG